VTEKNETVTKISFYRRASDLPLRDRMRSGITPEGLGVELLLPVIEKKQLRWFPGEVIWACSPRWRPRGRPGTNWSTYTYWPT